MNRTHYTLGKAGIALGIFSTLMLLNFSGYAYGFTTTESGTMTVVDTAGYPGDHGIVIPVEGEWNETIKGFKTYIKCFFEPPLDLTIDNINFEDCYVEHPYYDWTYFEYEPDRFYIYAMVQFSPEVPADTGRLFNVVVNISQAAQPRTYLLTLDISNCFYYTEEDEIVPALHDGQFEIYNRPPAAPTLSGPTEGIVETLYDFTTVTTDPDGHNVQYNFSWGDGTYSGWTNFVNSNTPVSKLHNWTTGDEYEVLVQAKDQYNYPSNWSQPHIITIREPKLEIGEIKGGFFKVDAEIKNTGNGDATNVTWNITLSGGALIFKGKEASGTLPTLEQGTNIHVLDKPILGFSQIKITVKAIADNAAEVTGTADGFIFFFYVIVKNG